MVLTFLTVFMLPAYKCVPAGIPFPTRLSFPNPCSFFPAFALPINHSPQLCFRKILLIRKDCFQPLPLFPLRFPAAPAALQPEIPALNCFDTTKNRQHIFCPCRLFFLAAPENQNQNRRIHLPRKLAVFYKPLCSSNCFWKGTGLPQTYSPDFSPTILPYLPQPSL